MRSFVVTIVDEVCARNGKDETMQANLVSKLQEYGTVEPYEDHIAKFKAEHERVKALACRDEFEFAVLKACRAGVDNAVAAVNTEKEKYRTELANNKEKLEMLKANITAVLGD